MTRLFEVFEFPYDGCWLLELPDVTLNGEPTYSLRAGRFTSDGAEPLHLRIVKNATPMDFSFTAMGVPVASKKVAAVLRELAGQDVTLFASEIEGINDPYWVVNIRFTVTIAVREAAQDKISVLDHNSPRPISSLEDMAHHHSIFRVREKGIRVMITEPLKDGLTTVNSVGPGLIALDGPGTVFKVG